MDFPFLVDIETMIDGEANLRIHTVRGKLVFDLLMKKLGEIYSLPGFKADMHALWDLREADLSAFTTAEVHRVKDYVKKRWGKKGVSRAALVVEGDMDYGLSRMYEMLMESETSSEVRVFRDFDEALQWVTS